MYLKFPVEIKLQVEKLSLWKTGVAGQSQEQTCRSPCASQSLAICACVTVCVCEQCTLDVVNKEVPFALQFETMSFILLIFTCPS